MTSFQKQVVLTFHRPMHEPKVNPPSLMRKILLNQHSHTHTIPSINAHTYNPVISGINHNTMTIFTLTFGIFNLLFLLSKAFSTDTLTLSQSLPDGTTLSSKDETFELGFFSLRNSANRYLGIWFKTSP